MSAQETFKHFVPAANEVTLTDRDQVTWSLEDLFTDVLTAPNSTTGVHHSVKSNMANALSNDVNVFGTSL